MEKKNEKALEERLLEDILKYGVSEALHEEMQELDQNKEDEFEPSEQFFENMEELFKKEERKEYWKECRTKLMKVAAGVAIASVCIGATVMNVEAFRVPIFNLFIEVQEKFSRIHREEEGNDRIPEELSYLREQYPNLALPANVPEGFVHMETKGEENNYWTKYKKNDTKEFSLNQFKVDGNVAINTERKEGKPINYRGQDYTIKIDGEEITLLWEEQGYSFYISGNISKKEALSIAESLYFAKK